MAYIDPNTGGMLFQALAASFAIVSGVALLFSRQIRAGFARLRRRLREMRGGEIRKDRATELADPSDHES